MNMRKRFIPSTLTAALTLVLLSACGDGDIEGIKERELASAQIAFDAAQEQQNLDSDNTDSGTSDSGETDTETDTEADATNTDSGDTPDSSNAVPATFNANELELIFSDEFNGDSLDSSKWVTAQQWGPDLVINDELQYYVDTQSDANFGYNPFSFDGESLIISAIETPANLQAVANNQPYLSGVLTSAGKFEITHGYIEARIDFPAGTGLWPAFWMLSSDFTDLKPQLFIAESKGDEANSVFHNYNYHDANGNLRSPGQWQVTQDGFDEGFHTYGVSWKSDELLFYIDGTPTYRIIGENVSKQAMYLILNLAVGGVWAGSPDSETQFPGEMKIDYVRAYEHVGS